MKEADEDLALTIKKNSAFEEECRNKIVKDQKMVNNQTRIAFENVDKKMKTQNDVTKAHKMHADEINKNLESLESIVTAFREQMKDFRAEAFSTIRGRSDDLQEQMNETNKFLSEVST